MPTHICLTQVIPEFKDCTKCNTSLPEAAFRRCKHTKTGLQSWCIKCTDRCKDEKRKLSVKNPRFDLLADEIGKLCTHCREHKPYCQFKKTVTLAGYSSWCKPCCAALEDRSRRLMGIPEKVSGVVLDDAKECLHCHQILSVLAFSPSERGIHGRQAYCRRCAKLRYYSKEKSAAYIRQWRQGNDRWRIQHCQHQHRRRALMSAPVPIEFMTSLYAKETCAYCLQPTHPKDRTADHVWPLSRGGPHAEENLTMACIHCNSSKGAKTPQEYASYKIQSVHSQIHRKLFANENVEN